MKKYKNVADDVWFEIFLHLPLNSIYSFRCVCKVWFSILTNPNFLKQWYQLNNLSLPWALLGHFVITGQTLSPMNKSFAYPDSHSRFLSPHKNGFSLRFINDTELYLLGSANGLFLCGTNFVLRVTYFVCNPLTQKWVSVPPSPRGSVYRDVVGFMCSDDYFSVSASFKVIRIPDFKKAVKEFKVEIFLSDLGEWDFYDVLCPGDFDWDYSICDNLFAHDDVFYWFQKKNNKILAVRVDGNGNNRTCGIECRVINMPDQPVTSYHKLAGRCIGESEGLVCYASYKEAERSLTVWVLDGEQWNVLCKDVPLHDMLEEIKVSVYGGAGVSPITIIQVLGFNPFDKSVVLLGYKQFIWAFDTSYAVVLSYVQVIPLILV